MRVERLRVEAFGRLHSLDSGPEPLPGLVAVLGPNEAGKSTLFHFLTSLLYGFYPASREGHPYAPWNGADPSGAAALRLDGGSLIEVERRLRSQPGGRLTRGEATEEIRNRTLPWADHIPRAVFLQVFALTLGDLATLEDETWGRIQDRLVGAMGSGDLLSARQVVADMEQAAGELWRPSRRGNQRIRRIQSDVLELRDRRRGSAEQDRRLRDMVAELERVRGELQEAREERSRTRAALERIQHLAPIRAQLRRVEALRTEAGPVDDLAGIPPEPEQELEARSRRLRSAETRLEEIRGGRLEPEAAVDAHGDGERRIAARREEISAVLTRSAGLRGSRARLAALRQELDDLRRRLESQSVHVLTRALDGAGGEALAGLSVAELRQRVRRFRSALEEKRVREVGERQAPPPRPDPFARPLAGAALLAVGLVLVAAGLAVRSLPLGVAGGSGVGLGVALLLAFAVKRKGGRPAPGGTAGGPDAERTLAAERAALSGALAALPVREELLAEPDEALVAGLERLQDMLRDRAARAPEAASLAEALLDADRRTLALATELGLEPGRDPEAALHLLEEAARRAETTGRAAAAAERELARLEREERRLEAERAEASAQLGELQERVTTAGGGDLQRGVRAVRARIQARDRSLRLEEELERSHPDLGELRARILEAESRGDSWTLEDDDLGRRKALLEELTDRVESLATRAEALDRDVAHLRDEDTVDAVDGAIAALQEEESVLLRERDRLWIVAQLLKEADRRFREEHQPDLLLRAGRHLSSLTGGRYDRIVVDETSAGERFHLAGPALAQPVPLAPPVSTGTLEQAYLALRLAIVDHLDRGQEKLPLFVDEILVNWDEQRRRRGVEVLSTLSRDRQIFVFTCHPDIAGELEATGARVLDLGNGLEGR